MEYVHLEITQYDLLTHIQDGILTLGNNTARLANPHSGWKMSLWAHRQAYVKGDFIRSELIAELR